MLLMLPSFLWCRNRQHQSSSTYPRQNLWIYRFIPTTSTRSFKHTRGVLKYRQGRGGKANSCAVYMYGLQRAMKHGGPHTSTRVPDCGTLRHGTRENNQPRLTELLSHTQNVQYIVIVFVCVWITTDHSPRFDMLDRCGLRKGRQLAHAQG